MPIDQVVLGLNSRDTELAALKAELKEVKYERDNLSKLGILGREIDSLRAKAAQAETAQWKPSNADIEKMVSRFLCWTLPTHFTPDGGINFDNTNPRHWPTGTNLFYSSQADEMFRHCLNVPLPAPPTAKDE